ncbi:sulfate adenylyltransferase subunit CysN [Candidatus Tachikawaea gelatinosa]|uniref:sulfate adenylyltransferase n=1 Tax=Candidatus Tachikawaea gelatinosa TaxID=1410383 RepID=A0A090ALL5_9ENTR|nr:sulfate adenylyltransferase subunit CysN [Candidatus Tachikawaea gelatinosa]BAP58539.1 sulfate adenylyltransferase subunit 1 [Candidatus Tachikawaea gelatinosa]
MNNNFVKENEKLNIKNWIINQQKKTLLRFITCGSVDDGKSTLIGRLLYDTSQIYEDQLSLLNKNSKRYGNKKFNLAFLVDGLQAEREQGITIDVSYRYFSSEKRKFIIADTPGHEQYTRNMATGASNSDVAILLVDVRKGLLDQTRRHSFICILLGIKILIVTINKMDLVSYKESDFLNIKLEYLKFIKKFEKKIKIYFIPISALKGDNVVFSSKNMLWYKNKTLINILNTIELLSSLNNQPMRFPIQYVNYSQSDFRGYSGTVASGSIEVGNKVKFLPSSKESMIKKIVTFDGDKKKAYAGESITIVLKDYLDISRGDICIALNEKKISGTKHVIFDLVWMSEKPLTLNQTYYIKFCHKKLKIHIEKILSKININTLKSLNTDSLQLNEIGSVLCFFEEKLYMEEYCQNKTTGSIILIDSINNLTVGAGMVKKIIYKEDKKILKKDDLFELELNKLIRQYFPHWNACDLLKNKYEK